MDMVEYEWKEVYTEQQMDEVKEEYEKRISDLEEDLKKCRYSNEELRKMYNDKVKEINDISEKYLLNIKDIESALKGLKK